MQSDLLQSIDPRALGRQLQTARRARGRTQQEAADHLGVARTTVTAIEKGERRIQPLELTRLAAFYGRHINELLGSTEPSEQFAVQLRAVLGSAPSSVEEEIDPSTWEFQRLCEDYAALERLSGALSAPRQFPPIYPIEGMDPEIMAEDVAGAERNRLGLGDGPLIEIRSLLENDAGVRIFYMDLPSRVGAMFAFSEALGGCIAVNRKHPEERRRMSIAHEYSHFLTARHQPEIAVAGRYHRSPERERFADAFARCFLMPESGLRRRFNELKRSRGGKSVTPADLCSLAHLYFVSVEALTRRLEELRLLSSGIWDRLEQAGFRVREAQEILKLPARSVPDQLLPARYMYLAIDAHLKEEISEGQLARFLRVDRLEARRLVEEFSGGAAAPDPEQAGALVSEQEPPLPTRGG
jgi:Zn-dependent peptidase ImmA (M78 family)/DNA-binding XRE family transcriptional regulator